MPKSNIPFSLGESPLTDPRAGEFGVVPRTGGDAGIGDCSDRRLPDRRDRSEGVYAEVDPVDNRAEVPPSPGQGGGGLGDIGGMSDIPLVTASDGKSPQGGAVIRSPKHFWRRSYRLRSPSRARRLACAAWPSDNRSGLVPGSGSGGGGGAGGGSGGGAGRGIGPGTQFFGPRDHAHSFAYVIDCSGSMATRNSLEVAKREMLASISQLPPDAQFAVIFYNLQARMLTDPLGKRGLMAATAPNKARVQTQLATIAPDGGTDHMTALRTACAQTRGHLLSDRRGFDVQ